MKTVEVKNVRIGEGMPKICVPVTASNIENIKKQARDVMMSPADLAELRADHLMNVRDKASLQMVIAVLKRELEGRPVLFTLRTSDEGGLISVSDDEYLKICCDAIDSENIDLIDIEFSRPEGIRKKIQKMASAKNVKVVMSFHDFHAVPSSAELLNMLTDMKLAGADIVKAAVMPRNTGDVLNVLGVSAAFAEAEDAVPVIMIAMGSIGAVSRVSGEIFGSAVTFGRVGSGSAPGQINADDLDRVLRVLHDSAEDRQKNQEKSSRFTNDTDAKAEGAGRRNIVLVGFMGAGKSTVANVLSEKTGYSVAELDDMIVESEGMTISDIFDSRGEAYFREAETKLVRQLSNDDGSDPVIISCGGGTVLRQQNVDELRRGGAIVLLKASPDTIYERVKRIPSSRPLLSRYMSRGYISWLMKQRDDAYMSAADFVVDVDGKPLDRVAEDILHLQNS